MADEYTDKLAPSLTEFPKCERGDGKDVDGYIYENGVPHGFCHEHYGKEVDAAAVKARIDNVMRHGVYVPRR